MAVDLEIIIRIIIEYGWIDDVNRNIRKTPAVTNVDEWTRAEIGVGAAIAIGNHAEKGNCALFEHLAIINKIKIKKEYSLFKLKFQFDDRVISPIEIRIKISPTRFLRIVIVPDAAEEKFW